MVTGRTKGFTLRGKGNVVLVAAQLDDADGNPTEEYVLLRADEFGRLRTVGGGGAGVTAFLALTDTPGSYVGQSLLGVRVNVGETALEFAAIPAHSRMMPQMDDVGGTTWGIPGWGLTATGATVITVDRLYYIPIYVERSRTFTQIGLHATSSVGGTVARLGIYEATFDGVGDMTPGDLVLDAGTVSLASSGLKSIAIAETLAEGFHFLAISADGAVGMIHPDPILPIWGPVTGRNTVINLAVPLPVLSVDVVDGAAAFPDPATAPVNAEGFVSMFTFIGE